MTNSEVNHIRQMYQHFSDFNQIRVQDMDTCRDEVSDSIKCGELFWLAENRLASQGLFSVV
jgi:hypothetical protein